jgi:hypothetical protein
MAEHALAPWTAERDGRLYVVRDANRDIVADCVDARNAQLIAATPELLEALRQVVNLAQTADDSMFFGHAIAGRNVIQAIAGETRGFRPSMDRMHKLLQSLEEVQPQRGAQPSEAA